MVRGHDALLYVTRKLTCMFLSQGQTIPEVRGSANGGASARED